MIVNQVRVGILFFLIFSCGPKVLPTQESKVEHFLDPNRGCAARESSAAKCYKVPFPLATLSDKAALLNHLPRAYAANVALMGAEIQRQLTNIKGFLIQKGEQGLAAQIDQRPLPTEQEYLARLENIENFVRGKIGLPAYQQGCSIKGYDVENFYDNLQGFANYKKINQLDTLYNLPSFFSYGIDLNFSAGAAVNGSISVGASAEFYPYVSIAVDDENNFISASCETEVGLGAGVDVGAGLGAGGGLTLGASVGAGSGPIRGLDSIGSIDVGAQGTLAIGGGVSAQIYANFNVSEQEIFGIPTVLPDRLPYTFIEVSVVAGPAAKAEANFVLGGSMPIEEIYTNFVTKWNELNSNAIASPTTPGGGTPQPIPTPTPTPVPTPDPQQTPVPQQQRTIVDRGTGYWYALNSDRDYRFSDKPDTRYNDSTRCWSQMGSFLGLSAPYVEFGSVAQNPGWPSKVAQQGTADAVCKWINPAYSCEKIVDWECRIITDCSKSVEPARAVKCRRS